MRIGFTGSQGVGKTTVSELMRADQRFDDYFFPVSSARLLISSGINTEATPLNQLLIMLHRVNNIQASPNVVSDRTAIDSWAYSQYQSEHVWNKDEVPPGYEEITRRFVELAMRDIDLLVYFPVFWLPEYDGVRSPVLNYQTEIDKYIIKGIERFYAGPVLTMCNESASARADRIIQLAFSVD